MIKLIYDTTPTGGDLSEYECTECNEMMIYAEYGDSSSDISEFGLMCEECEFEVQPDEMEGFCEESSHP
jgi:hypothetical protein